MNIVLAKGLEEKAKKVAKMYDKLPEKDKKEAIDIIAKAILKEGYEIDVTIKKI